ncbi:hypothetical protein BJ912DRAFT_862222 [Pholiota molesta]|nr:hypothetical protein BJ912DRAFT_862222 [Pholiota molesta]
MCSSCTDNHLAVWRCVDCSLSQPVCRRCMRSLHVDNPFHVIQRWTGTYFRRAELWEVGTYILVRHHQGQPSLRISTNSTEIFGKISAPKGYGRAGISSQCSAATATDSLQNAYVRIVHTNGVHCLAMVSCQCQGSTQLPLDLVASRLWPTSFHTIRTLFTNHLLRYFRLCNLELKASAYQFYMLLRRLSNPIAPGDVPDLYREFRRLSRLWRWTKKLRGAGFGHNGKDPMHVDRGELANYCPACPQPGKNLRSDWKSDVDHRYVYRRMFVADGNFKADHVKQQNVLDDDIWLSEGGGMDPDRTEYNEFLRAATEQFTKAPCESTFRAIMNALMGSKSCDRTGKASIACARHGCYAPNALVDLFKGEQQKNVDFAFWKALETTGVDPQQGVILMYDIACQYCVHLEKRLEDQCFFRSRHPSYPAPALSVVKFWSHCALGMSEYLCNRHDEACTTLEQAANYFRDISTAAGLQAVTLWTAEVVDAESKRLEKPEVMDIYAARIAGLNENMSAPVPVTGDANVIEWLEFAITVEEKQLEIQYLNRQHGADIEKIQKLRHALTPLVATLNELQLVAGVFQTRHQSGHEMNDSLSNWDNLDNGTASDSASSSPAEGEDGDGNPVESVELCIPSNGNVPDTYANVELQIRKNQAMTDLNLIRDLVADMSFRWTEDVRKGSRKEVRTRGRAALKDREKALSLRCQIYTRCRSRLVALGADPQTLQQFRVLTKADTKCSTAVLTPNMPGSTTVKLSWIWHSVTQHTSVLTSVAVRRVHWLRARAQHERWREERTLVRYEMEWTVRYFLFKSKGWLEAAENRRRSPTLGATAYAHRQSASWRQLALKADRAFQINYRTYESPL